MRETKSSSLRVAILGSGNIGTDLLVKTLRSSKLKCTAFLGRNPNSPGIARAISLGVPVSFDGIEYILQNPASCDLVFDATSAEAHKQHAPLLLSLGKVAVDLTPAKIGEMCVPAVNGNACVFASNINMITCGGQASIPIADIISKTLGDIDYIEVVSSIASRSAGPATRQNLDEYIHTTEEALRHFTQANLCKAILNLNPAVPCINMQTTVMAKVDSPDLVQLNKNLKSRMEHIRRYVPGYELILGPVYENNRIVITVRVKGVGDYLPDYAGNLDIINCAAIAVAEDYADHLALRRSDENGGLHLEKEHYNQ